MSQVGAMAAKDRLKRALDSINEVLREVQRLQPSVPPLSPRVRNQLQSTTRKLKIAVSEIETVMREPDSSSLVTRETAPSTLHPAEGQLQGQTDP
jgi:hypothetical protein